MKKENKTTNNSKPMAYDTLLASVISLGRDKMLVKLMYFQGYLTELDYTRTDNSLANKIIEVEAYFNAC